MIEKLKELLNNSYAKYSNYRVSAILVTNELKEYKTKRKRLIHKLKDSNLYKDYFYQEMIKENKNKSRITKKLAFSLGINIVLFVAVVAMIIK